MLGRKTVAGSNETISQGTFVRDLLKHISTHPERDFDAARTNKPLTPDPKLFSTSTSSVMKTRQSPES
jgi:hypothetical protein